MKSLLFLLLAAGITIGLYYGGLSYEKQSPEFLDYQKVCLPLQQEKEIIQTELKNIQQGLEDFDTQYVEKFIKAAKEMQHNKVLGKNEKFAIELLQIADSRTQVLLIQQRIEEINNSITNARHEMNRGIAKNEESIINNKTWLSSAIIAERNKVGKYYSSKPNLQEELAQRTALENRLAKLRFRVDKANANLEKRILKLKHDFEIFENNALNERTELEGLHRTLSNHKPKDAFSLLQEPYYQKILLKNSSFLDLRKNYEQATYKTEKLIQEKNKRLQEIEHTIDNHPYTLLQKDAIKGIRSLYATILIGIDTVLIIILYIVFYRRSTEG